MTPTPPGWAEALLRALLKPADVDSVSGDLLEEYRDTIHRVRGQSAADAWYVRQVLGFVWRSARVWAVLFQGAFVTRTALDWLAPPVDFGTRSMVSTFVGIGLLLATGLSASLRSGSLLAGTLTGVAATAIAAVLNLVVATGLLAIWHDASTMAAIHASGGLGEVFLFPVVLILPGAAFGTVGGIVGATIRRFRSA
jgi:hypothetical protein